MKENPKEETKQETLGVAGLLQMMQEGSAILMKNAKQDLDTSKNNLDDMRSDMVVDLIFQFTGMHASEVPMAEKARAAGALRELTNYLLIRSNGRGMSEGKPVLDRLFLEVTYLKTHYEANAS